MLEKPATHNCYLVCYSLKRCRYCLQNKTILKDLCATTFVYNEKQIRHLEFLFQGNWYTRQNQLSCHNNR